MAGTSRSESVVPKPDASKDVVRRVGEALQSIPIRDGSRVRLSLHPAHLGGLEIELSVAGSRLRGRMRTETEAARDLILTHLEDLRRDLERRGIRISRFEVDVDGSSRGQEERAKGGVSPRSHRRQVLDLRA